MTNLKFLEKTNLKIIFLISIFLLGFIVRLYRFDSPVADWHSFRQSDTAAVSKIYVNEGYDLLYPKYFDISNVQSGFDNPYGYRFVEFPLYNFLHAFLFKSFGIFSFDQWGRLINIVSSLVTGLIIYALLKKYANTLSAFGGLLSFLFFPYSIFYSRVILPEITMVTAIMAGIYFFDKYLEKGRNKRKVVIFYVFSIISTAIALLLKPFALFFVLPFIALAYKKYGIKFIFKWHLWLFAAISVAPLLLWRLWISQHPEGIPVSSWLLNGNGIRFRPAFFRWIFFERITKLILGYSGIILSLFGAIFILKNKNALFFISFATSSLIYLFTIATGNVQHDYYQILIIPTMAMFAGIGLDALFRVIASKTNRYISVVIITAIFISSIYFSWNLVKDYFNINDNGMVHAAQRADLILPSDAIVIAPYDGSTTFLNLIGRRGWPVFQVGIEELILRGAQYLVIANPTPNDFSGFGTTYEIVDSSKEYLILKLK